MDLSFLQRKQVAIVRAQRDKLNNLFFSVLTARVVLIFISFLGLLLVTNFITKLEEIKTELLFGAGIFVGNALIPIWFFQGMENMKFMTIINFVVRLISTVLIFFFVKTPDDINIALGFQSVGYVSGGLISLFLAINLFQLKFTLPSVKDIVYQLTRWMAFVYLNFGYELLPRIKYHYFRIPN